MRQKLRIENPVFAAQWDDEKNAELNIEDYTGGSNKYVWWRCYRCGYSWYAQINKRFSCNRGCPVCSGQKVKVGYNDLATTHPHIAAEWDDERNGDKRPEHYTKGADVKIWWKCSKCGYKWEAVLYSRTSKKPTGCPCCAGNILVVGKNDLQTVNPELADQWDDDNNNGLHACDVAANDNRKARWLCGLKHSWEASVASRNSGKDCPICKNRKLKRGFNDLATRNPALAAEWHDEENYPLTAHDVIFGSNDYAWWRCKKGHSWRAQISNRANGTGCPHCEHRVVTPGETDLATIRPEIADAWDYEQNYPLTPDQVTAWAGDHVWWKCKKCGQSYNTAISNRRSADSCPYCHGKRPIVGKTDFAKIHPELLDEWDFEQNILPPTAYTCGSDKRVRWRCSEGHSWEASIFNRHNGSKCPVCEAMRDKHVVTVGVNDLASQYAGIAVQWDASKNKGLTAEQVMPGSNVKPWWLCKRGHSWQASVLSRTLGSRCPRCNGKTPMRTHFVS